jgi:trimethylamine--corrinoid protein Co-methyltransferase
MVQGESEACYAVAMARVIAGGTGELRRRPPLSALMFAVSPLVIDRDGGDATLEFAAAGVPVVAGSGPATGTTAPATAAGAMVQSLAEVLAQVALVQLAFPAAPVIGYSVGGAADPRTGKMVGYPLDIRDPALGVDLVHRVGLPSLHGTGGADAELPGTWTAAAQAGPSLTMAAWSGSELTVGLGITNGDTLWSAEALMLDDHLYHQARYTVMETVSDDEALALDVIDAVGPGGHFLSHPHTRKHMRTSFLRGMTLELDERGGYRDAIDVARERARHILEDYHPEPLGEDKATELRQILTAADAELRS